VSVRASIIGALLLVTANERTDAVSAVDRARARNVRVDHRVLDEYAGRYETVDRVVMRIKHPSAPPRADDLCRARSR